MHMWMFTAALIVKAKRAKKNINRWTGRQNISYLYYKQRNTVWPQKGIKYWHMLCVCVCFVTQSYPTPCDPMDCSPPGSSVHGDPPGKNTGVGCHALFQGIFPNQGSKLGLPHCRWILYHLSHQGSPRIPEWVAYPFSKGSSWSRNQTRVSCIACRFFTSWATREAPM